MAMWAVKIIASVLAVGLSFGASAESLTVKVTDDKGRTIPGAVATFTPLEPSNANMVAPADIVIRQENLQFQPFTTLAPVGSEITFKNEDDVLHHVFSFSKIKRFNLTLFGRDEPQSVTFENTGIVTVGCNIHDGMIAHIFISDAPHAGQSGDDGVVHLQDVPAGPGQLVIWHPLMRQRENRIVQEVVVSADAEPVQVSSRFRRGIKRSSDY